LLVLLNRAKAAAHSIRPEEKKLTAKTRISG